MISCPSAWLIKLCVVFMLNMSLFTTGTAPPLREPQIQSQQENALSKESAASTKKASSLTYLNMTLGHLETITFPSNKATSSYKTTTDGSLKGMTSFTAKKLEPAHSSYRNPTDKISDNSGASAEGTRHKSMEKLSSIISSTSSNFLAESLKPASERPKIELSTPIPITITKEEESSSFGDYIEEFKDTDLYPQDSSESQGIIFDKDYSIEEVAEYIFLTGDEVGVASTFNDLIDEGLMFMSREDTIKFLEGVQTHLNNLEDLYKDYLMAGGKSNGDAKDASSSSGASI